MVRRRRKCDGVENARGNFDEHCLTASKRMILKFAEMTTVVRFFNVLMNALENDMARKSALPLVSIQIWKSRDEKRLEIELESAMDVQKMAKVDEEGGKARTSKDASQTQLVAVQSHFTFLDTL